MLVPFGAYFTVSGIPCFQCSNEGASLKNGTGSCHLLSLSEGPSCTENVPSKGVPSIASTLYESTGPCCPRHTTNTSSIHTATYHFLKGRCFLLRRRRSPTFRRFNCFPYRRVHFSPSLSVMLALIVSVHQGWKHVHVRSGIVGREMTVHAFLQCAIKSFHPRGFGESLRITKTVETSRCRTLYRHRCVNATVVVLR